MEEKDSSASALRKRLSERIASLDAFRFLSSRSDFVSAPNHDPELVGLTS